MQLESSEVGSLIQMGGGEKATRRVGKITQRLSCAPLFELGPECLQPTRGGIRLAEYSHSGDCGLLLSSASGQTQVRKLRTRGGGRVVARRIM